MADVRMVQRRNGPSLAFHALLQFGRRRKVGSQNFNCNGAIEADVPRTIHLAHPSSAQGRLNFVGAKFRAGGQSHWCGNYSLRSLEDLTILAVSPDAFSAPHFVMQRRRARNLPSA